MELANFAMRDDDTQGREFPEDKHPYRTEYQRDRDRIVHTKAFRRLEKKTQVFAPHFSDHFRNRLTHTIEVSQIARTISGALRLNTDLCEVLALSHDIGHPPFGHEGEQVLNDLMAIYGSGFEHNLHALRIVEDFELKYPDFRGLNLTFEVREGIIKHSRDYGPSERTYVDLRPYRLGERPPLEAQLIDLADEIAYNSADLDDGYASGLITLDRLMGEVTIFRRLFRKTESHHRKAPEKLKVSETLRALIDKLVTNLISHTECQIAENQIDSVPAVRAFDQRLVSLDPETAQLNLELKKFLRGRLYDHSVLQSGRESVRHLLSDLFNFYLKQPERLPKSHSERIEKQGIHRVACDYIAGMTDSYAEAKHHDVLAGND
jgi:dGTPase